jgi:hypothetical protein
LLRGSRASDVAPNEACRAGLNGVWGSAGPSRYHLRMAVANDATLHSDAVMFGGYLRRFQLRVLQMPDDLERRKEIRLRHLHLVRRGNVGMVRIRPRTEQPREERRLAPLVPEDSTMNACLPVPTSISRLIRAITATGGSGAAADRNWCLARPRGTASGTCTRSTIERIESIGSTATAKAGRPRPMTMRDTSARRPLPW